MTVEALSSFFSRLVPELAGEDLQASGSSPTTTAKRSVRLSAVSIGKPSKRVMPLAILKQHGCRLPDPVSHFSQNLFLAGHKVCSRWKLGTAVEAAWCLTRGD